MRKTYTTCTGSEIFQDLNRNVMMNMTELDMRGCYVGNYWMNHIIYHLLLRHPHLEYLDISQTDIDTLSISTLFENLCQFSKLRILKCSQLDMTSNDILLFVAQKNGIKHLEEIDFSHNHLNEVSAFYLAKAISFMKSLKIINLSFNNIGNTGLKYLSVALEKVHAIETILLKCNILSLSQIEWFFQCLHQHHCESIKKLSFCHCSDFQNYLLPGKDRILSHIAQCVSEMKNLNYFGWSGNELNQPLLHAISKIPNLSLNFTSNTFHACPALTNTENLEIKGWNARHVRLCLEKVFSCTSILSLNMNYIHSLDDCLSYFGEWKFLESISLTNCQITDEMVEKILGKNYHNLKNLNLSNNLITGKSLPKILSFVEKLTSLNLQHNHLDNKDTFDIIRCFVNKKNHQVPVELILYNRILSNDFHCRLFTFFHQKFKEVENHIMYLEKNMIWDDTCENHHLFPISIQLEFEMSRLFESFVIKYNQKVCDLQNFWKRKKYYFQFNHFLEKNITKNHILHMKDVQFLISEFL